MIVSAAIFIMLLSGSFFGAVVWKKRFEETFPVFVFGLVLILYIFGLFGGLKYGVFFIYLLILSLYVAGIIAITRKKNIKDAAGVFFTPAFWIYVVLYLFINLINRNRLACTWDEFSHWMDCVKAMTFLDDFVTNPASDSMFRSYPPAMALFQYFFQKVCHVIRPGIKFDEWHMFVAYQMLAYTAMIPFAGGIHGKKIIGIVWKSIVTCIVFALAPQIVYSCFTEEGFYGSIMIDPFLGVLVGCGFAMVLFHRDNSITYKLYITLLCAVAVLSKDVGLFFAVFIAVIFLWNEVFEGGILRSYISERKKIDKTLIRNILVGVTPLLVAVVAKLTWKLELSISKAQIMFGEKPKVLEFFRLFFGKGDSESWQGITVANFKAKFFEPIIHFEGLNISISFFAVTVLDILAVYAIYRLFRKNRVFPLVVFLVQIPVYVLGLGATYITGFSEWEATHLAVYSRYMNMEYLAIFMVMVMGTLVYLRDIIQEKSQFIAQLCLSAGLFLLAPMSVMSRYLNRDLCRESVAIRTPMEDFSREIEKYCEENKKVYLICEGSAGFDYWVIHFNVRPVLIEESLYWWTLGEGVEGYGSWNINSEQWADLLFNSETGYDYVAVYHTNDYFNDNYGNLFENPSQLVDGAIFKVDRNAETLIRCN